MGVAGGAGVNVRPARAALTQFHQKLEGGGGFRSSAHPEPGGSWAGSAAGPPRSPAQVARSAGRRRRRPSGLGAWLAAVPSVSGYASSRSVLRPTSAAGVPECAWADRPVGASSLSGPRAPSRAEQVCQSPPSGHAYPWNPEARTLKVTPPSGAGRRAPGSTMAGRLLAQAGISTVGVWFLCALGLQGAETELPSAPPELSGGAACLSRFTSGVPAFMLDTEASVSNGATFLGSPTVRRGRDCVRACCTTQNCNLALVELQPEGGEDAISACFLMNCLYEQNFVCKFAPKEGFINYLTQELYHSYRELRTRGFGGEEGCGPEGTGWLWSPGQESYEKELEESFIDCL